LGGLLLAAFGWRALFAVNLPIVVVVLVVLSRSVPDTVDRPDAGSRPEPADTSDGGPTDIETPLANGTFVAAFSTQALTVLAQYALLLIAPMLLDDRGWSSGEVGFAVTALTLGMIVMSPLGGRLGDEWGRRRPVMLGLTAATLAVAASAVFGTDVTSALLIATLLGFGLGYGIASPSILTAGIEAAPEHRVGLAAGLLSMSRYVGSIIASVLLTVVVTDDAEGVGTMLVLSTVALAISLVTASRLPRLPISNDDLVAVA
jgi:DHA2 family methylenomycin A resistance protein-like MFS transporter